MSISQFPSGWTITRSDERIVVQHVSGSFYAAAKEGDSGIAESILYMLADSLLSAPLSPAHIEDGEGIDWSCLPGYLIDHYEGWSITEEGLQFAISEMLKDPNYLRVQAEKAALSAPPAAGVPEGWKLVPIEPTEEMWGGVARSLMLWLDFGNPTVEKLREHFDMLGIGWPEWMDSEAEMKGPGVPSKGTRCTLIYKAMLAAAPTPPASEQQRAVVMPERKAPFEGADGPPDWRPLKNAEVSGWNACLAEFLRLNPHLTKGEGV